MIMTMLSGTGIFQPANIGLQWIIKHFMQQETLNYLVLQYKDQLKNSLTLDQVKFTTSIKLLCVASIGALEQCYNWLTSEDGKKIVKLAWDKCIFKEHSLSAEWFTSPSSVPALISYLQTHLELYNKIKNKIGHVPGVDTELAEDTDSLKHNAGHKHNHSKVHMCVVVCKTLNLDLPSCDTVNPVFCVDSRAVQADKHGDLVAASMSKHVIDAAVDTDSNGLLSA